MDIKLTIYNEDMETVKKECTANMVKVPFGLVRKLMNLFKVENLQDTTQILDIIMTSWEDVTKLLGRIFPDVTEEEWDYVDTSELMRVILSLIKYVFAEMVKIPTDPKN